MQVEVLGREVRERERGEADPDEPAELRAVRRRLHARSSGRPRRASRGTCAGGRATRASCGRRRAARRRRATSIVPTSPGRRPAAARIAWSRNVVVVLPFVPVTAPDLELPGREAEERVGREARAPPARRPPRAAAPAGRAGARRSAPRPRAATASEAKSCPSARKPGTQTKSVPAVTRRASNARSVTSIGAGLSVRSGRTAWLRTSSSIPRSYRRRMAATGWLLRRGLSGGTSRYWSAN